MCFDLDSYPPIAPIAGGALDSARLVLTAEDGNRLAAFQARAANPTAAAMLILPDVRGLHPYYEELALRFAENGIHALVIDYFGRTAGTEPRSDGFDSMSHVGQTTWAGLQVDIRAGFECLRSAGQADGDGNVALFSVGFCFGGRLSYLAATLGLSLLGAIGFYGRPVGEGANGVPAPVDLAPSITGSVLAIFGGADQAIPAAHVAAFELALSAADVNHRIISYDGAPHSFFDRKATDYAEASAAAWSETIGFVRERTKLQA